MLLAIDIGNTHSVFALFDGEDTPLNVWRQETRAGRSADEYAAFLLPLLAEAGLARANVTQVLVSSVVPGADRAIAGFAQSYLDCDKDPRLELIGADATKSVYKLRGAGPFSKEYFAERLLRWRFASN